MSVKAKQSLEELSAYKAAATIESIVRKYGFAPEDIIKLEGNENRMGPSPKVHQALAAIEKDYSYYPDLNVTVLREKLAKRHQVLGEHIVFGNGSFELISLVGNAYINQGDEVIYVTPGFNWYRNVTVMNGGIPVEVPTRSDFTVDVEEIIKAITERTKVIFLCNPNNPTGTLLPSQDLLELIHRTPEDILLVIDEAYLDFSTVEYVDTVPLSIQKDNLLILKTFSKSYGLASLRVGYGIGNVEIIENLEKVKCPPNISMTAQVAAVAALEDEAYHQQIIENNKRGLELYYKTFDELGFPYIESHTNFVFVETGIDAAILKEAFLKRAIMIRSGYDYGFPNWIRITVGSYEDNQKVVKALKEIVEELKE